MCSTLSTYYVQPVMLRDCVCVHVCLCVCACACVCVHVRVSVCVCVVVTQVLHVCSQWLNYEELENCVSLVQVGLVSVYFYLVGNKVWSVSSISVWHHVQLSKQICPWDTLACCWDVKQSKPKLSASDKEEKKPIQRFVQNRMNVIQILYILKTSNKKNDPLVILTNSLA